jgi:hypothetical protein
MGLFKKKDDKKGMEKESLTNNSQELQIPELPELPKLPSLSGEEDGSEMELPRLPSFPNGPTGDRFSQNTIKHAVAGEKEVKPEEDAEDYEEENPMMPESLEENNQRTFQKQRIPREIIPETNNYSQKQSYPKKEEPVFIRLDKFEESLEIFKEAKEQILEIEHLLTDIKDLKEKEEEELTGWEDQIQEIKNQIEKVDQDIFSKI